ncbi:NFACT family protein [Natranaerofaba carboxydovora]|uniref:NFACT family protein n=1 Tax=Natranaerofaba carboxydovora TaxID=2742683 RepID=UPI001F134032|nr:NFACT family protein [Natranaerofaba carboxydovora]UMZ73288.1 hypothetical protein ACONDI_00841 [Natranaerofaba carboxydovora]
MPFDGFVTKSIEIDLNKHIKDAKINNVYQHNNHDISLHLRNFGKNSTLFISTHPNFCRVHLTDIRHENPDHPPSFCMLLRKYLKGGTIRDIKQYEGDRILDIYITHQDEFGLEKELILTVEIMGKHSNLILVNKKNKRILDGIKRIKREFSNMREIIPGNLFERPPGQNKENPWNDDLNPETLLNTIDDEIKTENLLFNHFQGVSPLLSRELAYRANLANKAAAELTKSQLDILIIQLNKLKTQILSNEIDPIFLWDVKKKN